MKKFTLLLALLFISMGLAVAQQTRVVGTVVDESGVPVAGASVTVRGTPIGVATDPDGRFVLDVPAGTKTLSVSFIGYQPVDVAVASTMNIRLLEDAKMIEDVVVTGYGTQKRPDFTGSATTVSMGKLAEVPTMSVGAKLAGAAAGVQVTSTSGQPGAVESIRIRGMGSINASNQPLFVIDGVPMLAGNANAGGFTYSAAGNSLLSTINVADIESMTVIKDAASASLYGSRAANGVIVITTKKGSAGKTLFTFSADAGVSDMAINYRPMKGGQDRRDFIYLARYNQRLDAGDTDAAATASATTWANTYASQPATGWTDWRKALIKQGSFQNYRFAVQGGNQSTQVYGSLSYGKNEGITLQQGYERYTGNLNVTHKAKNFTFLGSSLFTQVNQDVNSEGTSYSSPIMAISMTTSPSDFPYNADGTWNTTQGFRALNRPLANPLYTASINWDHSNITRSLNSITAGYEFIPGLSLKETLSYDYSFSQERVWWDPRSSDGLTAIGNYQIYETTRTRLISQSMLSYSKTFNDVHNLNALVSYETEANDERWTYARGSNFSTFKLFELSNAGTTSAQGATDQNRMISYVSRVNYNYNNLYYLGGSFRRDGTSRLAPSGRWGNFWSVSGSWRFTEESFMEPFRHILTDGKLRASYGVNGTLPTDNYPYMGLYGLGYKYDGISGMAMENIENESLSWEKNYSTDIGLEVSLWNRIALTFDWYNRDTKDLLYNQDLSRTSGFTSQLSNVASMNNRGYEIEIRTTNVQHPNLRWITGFTFTHNKNKLTGLSYEGQTEKIDGVLIYRIGNPYFSYYLYEYAGVDPKTGKESWYINKEGSGREATTDVTKANRILAGSYNPKLAGGFTSDLTWKWFDLNLTFTYTLGGHILDRATWLQSNGGINPAFNVPSFYDLDKTWKKEGDIAELPRIVYGSVVQPSTRWMISSDHLRLKSATLGFTLPQEWTRKVTLERARIYAAASNLFTIKSKDLYVDPEAPIDGLVTYQTPAIRTITFGVEVSF